METVAEVIARMAAIEGSLATHDGVARFNDLYLAVTREVEKNLAGEAFEDQRFSPGSTWCSPGSTSPPWTLPSQGPQFHVLGSPSSMLGHDRRSRLSSSPWPG